MHVYGSIHNYHQTKNSGANNTGDGANELGGERRGRGSEGECPGMRARPSD